LIEITRLLAKQLRTVIRKLLGNVRHDVLIRTGDFGFFAQVQGYEHAVQFHDPAPRESAELMVPCAALDDVQGQKCEPVALTQPKKKVLAASWQDRGVARSIQYALPAARCDDFPALPESLAANTPKLLAALHHAFETTDAGSSRYALACIQLRGRKGQIAATDGSQLLVQSGYTFGFEGEVLIPKTNVFGCSQLPQDQPVLIGKTEHHVTVRVGPWTFAIWIHKEGRFPQFEHILPAIPGAQTTLELAPVDAEFYLESRSRLPSTPDNHAVTLDLGGTIAVRAQTYEVERPTELILTNSRRIGDDVRVAIDRRFLARAATMQLTHVYLYGTQGALLAQDASRQYLWMPLNPAGAVKPTEDCLRIESPPGVPPAACVHPVPPATVPMSTSPNIPIPAATPETNNTSQPQPPRRKRASKAASALEQALAVREQLRGALTGTNELIQALKTEKRSQRSLKLALDSLKQLQAVA
jgi:hypothetical protein